MFAGLKVEIISLAYFRMFAKKSIWNGATTYSGKNGFLFTTGLFLLVVLWNQTSISNGFRDIHWLI